ncbi:MAG TPA: DUF3800 domain-containing protein [Terriglobales bacterium]
MPFTIYFDDSGTDPNQKVANATGLIIPAGRILQMEKEWENLKQKEEFSDFHTSEFVFKNADSEFANWKDSKHTRVFNRVIQITCKYGVQVFSFSVNKDDYNELVLPEIRQYAGRHHYSWAIRQVSMFAQTWKQDKKVSDPYEWLFDSIKKSDPVRKEIESMFAQLEFLTQRHNGIEHDYEYIDFRPRTSLAALQCVDLLAWTNYNVSLHKWKYRDKLHPFAKEAWDCFASMPKSSCPRIMELFPENNGSLDWNNPIFLTRAQIEQWIKKEQSENISLPYMKEWEEYRKGV